MSAWVPVAGCEPWLFGSNGAPAARCPGADAIDPGAQISWSKGKRLVFEGDGAISVPLVVLEEIVRRGKEWHWQPPPVIRRGAGT